jgi:hypothetical protein
MKRWMVIEVRGREKSWSWHVKADERYLEEWQADGVQIFILENSIPEWAVELGLTHIWCRVQDAWNFLRLW